jgi:dTDP-4-dehydrorhamnose 3,5-epimerase-like enzyme
MDAVSNKYSVNDIKQVVLPLNIENNGRLVVIEGQKDVPFSILRSFIVYAENGDVRGQHAHKKCSQLLICLNGKILVKCNDGESLVDYTLDNPIQGLLIPPGIWAEQTYETENTILMVLCDRLYEAEDYVRDFDTFLKVRASRSKNELGS